VQLCLCYGTSMEKRVTLKDERKMQNLKLNLVYLKYDGTDTVKCA
jgi:hypothetical protein